MKRKKTQYAWVYKPGAPKFTASEKTKILDKAKEIIKELPRVSQKVSRVEIRANRIYLYELEEQFIEEGVIYAKPLIDDKY